MAIHELATALDMISRNQPVQGFHARISDSGKSLPHAFNTDAFDRELHLP